MSQSSEVLIRDMDFFTFNKICQLLDAKKFVKENDARMLAAKIGMENDQMKIIFDGLGSGDQKSPTKQILASWETKDEATVGRLREILKDMGREDVIRVLAKEYPPDENVTCAPVQNLEDENVTGVRDQALEGQALEDENVTGVRNQALEGQALEDENVTGVRDQALEGQALEDENVPGLEDENTGVPDKALEDQDLEDENDSSIPSQNLGELSLEDTVDSSPAQVFISYQWDSQREALKLKGILERNNLSCWIDKQRIRGGDELHSELSKAINEAQVMISIVTKKYLDSRNCQREVNLALTKKPAIPVIPVHLEKVDTSSSPLGSLFAPLRYISCYEGLSDDKLQEIVESVCKHLYTTR